MDPQSDREIADLGLDYLHQYRYPIREYFRSLLNTNSRENSEIAVKAARLVNFEIPNQITKKLDETKADLNF